MLVLVNRLAAERDVSVATIKSWRTTIAALTKFAGALTPQQACQRINEFILYLADTRSPYTASFYRRTTIALLRQAADLGLCELPPKIRRVRLPDHQPVGFTDIELRLLLSFANPLQRAAILVARFAAPRRGDLFRVRWSQVDQAGVLRFTMGKNSRRHAVRLPPQAIVACAAVRDPLDDRLVPFRGSGSSWAKAWQRLGRRAGVNVRRRGLQAIRRTAASLVARDYDEVQAARLLGHAVGSGLAVFRRFYRVGEICDNPPPMPPAIAGD